jgi:hypothetical protein
MEHFVAPQFIDVEDRIIGPITTKQFILMIAGGVIVFLAFKILDQSAAIITTLITAGLVVLFGFVKINGRRFHEFIGSMLEVLKRPRIRVWHKHINLSEIIMNNKQKQQDIIKTDLMPKRKKIGVKNLRDLALLVDTGGKYFVE